MKMSFMKKSLAAALGGAIIATVGMVSIAEAQVVVDLTINESVPRHALLPTYSGPDLQNATAIQLNGAVFTVGSIQNDDTTVLNTGDAVTFSTNVIPLSPLGLIIDPVVLTITDGTNVYTEALGAITNINNASPGSIAVDYFGVFSGPGITLPEYGTFKLSANQAGLALGFVISTQTNVVGGGGIGPGVPESSTWTMMLAGFAALGFAGYRRKATSINA